jgi:adenylylsulfate kinase
MEQGFTVWVTGPDDAACARVAAAVAETLAERHVPVECFDARTPGAEALACGSVACAAGALARHGVATVVALASPSRAARDAARARLGRMIEVYVPTATAAPGYEPPDRPEVESADPGEAAARVASTLEVLGLIERDDRAYSAEEERQVIRRLKAFGYL